MARDEFEHDSYDEPEILVNKASWDALEAYLADPDAATDPATDTTDDGAAS